MNLDQLVDFVEDNAVEIIDLKFCNLIGGWHHITLPVEQLSERLFESGVGIDGSSVPGFKLDDGSDLALRPDPRTFHLDPFWERTALSLICETFEAGTLRPFPLDPRQVARRAGDYLKSTGVADESRWGPELEFYIFDRMAFTNEVNIASYRVDSREADWDRCEACCGDNSSTIQPQGGYHAIPPQDSYYVLRDRMSATIIKSGINVKYHHHEVGGPGQSEIEIERQPLLRSSDNVMLIKYICRMTARSAGSCVTFMPKPLYNEAGSGMHFHQNLFLKGQPVFHNQDGVAGLSQTALYYIGGLLKHGPALLAFTNPSTNSYKRLIPGFEAPVRAFFGLANRSAAVRIPGYADSPNQKRIEFRPPDGTCNPYLAMAAQLMAGLDGILNKIDPIEAGWGPFNADVTALPAAVRDAIPQLPTSLEEALNALREDHEFLLKADVFSRELLDNWIEWKYNRELREVNRRPHPYEMRLYFDL